MKTDRNMPTAFEMPEKWEVKNELRHVNDVALSLEEVSIVPGT